MDVALSIEKSLAASLNLTFSFNMAIEEQIG